MWVLGVALVLAALVAGLLGVRGWFNRMEDVRKPRDDEAESREEDTEQRTRAVTASTIFTSGSGRL